MRANTMHRKDHRQNINIMHGMGTNIRYALLFFVITAVIIGRNTWSHETDSRKRKNVWRKLQKKQAAISVRQ